MLYQEENDFFPSDDANTSSSICSLTNSLYSAFECMYLLTSHDIPV